MKQININELGNYSKWVSRLVGLEEFQMRRRDIRQIDEEYDKDKYAKLLNYCREKTDINVEQLRKQEYNNIEKLCISWRGKLYLASYDEYIKNEGILLEKLLKPYIKKVDAIVELGCGYGFNLSVLSRVMPNKTWIGGEYSENAIKIASLLFKDKSNITVKHFNWYEKEYKLIDDIDDKIVIFTRHSIEQLPSVADVLPRLIKYKNKIVEVVHLEPVFELHQNTTLGLLRRAYVKMNDYNRDLMTVLKNMAVKIDDVQYDLIGGNPLNPMSLVSWRFS